ncbi:hypothetical protein ACF044_10825 [Microbacterium sp. NPDC016588]
MRTGNRIQRVAISGDAPWSTGIGGAGDSNVTVKVNDADYPVEPGQVLDLFTPNDRMLVRWWGTHGGAHSDDIVMCAHKIESIDYDRDAGSVTVSAIDVLDFATWRLIDGVGANKYSTLTIAGRSASGAYRAALQRMIQWNADWSLPIDLPADGSGAFSGSWVFWKGVLISDVIKEIADRTGAELYLDPYATSTGGVRFLARVGTPITVGGVRIHVAAAETPLAGIRYRIDGKSQVTGVQGIGQGTGEDQKTKWAGGIINIPIRDTRVTFPDMVDQALQQATDTYYASHLTPVVQWDVASYTISDEWPPELVKPGRSLTLIVRGDPVIPDGEYTVRVVSVSGGNGRELKPEVQ